MSHNIWSQTSIHNRIVPPHISNTETANLADLSKRQNWKQTNKKKLTEKWFTFSTIKISAQNEYVTANMGGLGALNV